MSAGTRQRSAPVGRPSQSLTTHAEAGQHRHDSHRHDPIPERYRNLARQWLPVVRAELRRVELPFDAELDLLADPDDEVAP